MTASEALLMDPPLPGFFGQEGRSLLDEGSSLLAVFGQEGRSLLAVFGGQGTSLLTEMMFTF